ncbi:hypothetical protein GCM10010278_84770 [Streptomyces melanogenes]|nr:hypothetical protein GCM10010278_84770 [Streptomyces melanogenes]
MVAAGIALGGSLFAAAPANAVTWDPNCTPGIGEAWIGVRGTGHIYCYRDDGHGWAGVSDVGAFGSGRYSATFYLTYAGCNRCEWDQGPYVVQYPPTGTYISDFYLYG